MRARQTACVGQERHRDVPIQMCLKIVPCPTLLPRSKTAASGARPNFGLAIGLHNVRPDCEDHMVNEKAVHMVGLFERWQQALPKIANDRIVSGATGSDVELLNPRRAGVIRNFVEGFSGKAELDRMKTAPVAGVGPGVKAGER